jgi:hypothetical protein
MPALFTSMSIRPVRESTSTAAASTEAERVMSMWTGNARLPIDCATFDAPSKLTSATATAAPARARRLSRCR